MMRKIKKFFEKIFKTEKNKSTSVSNLTDKAPYFEENFSNLDTGKWTISNWQAPGGNDTNKSIFSPSNVFIKNGVLCLKLLQIKNPDGSLLSIGGEIATKESFGFGTYKILVRASSTAENPYDYGLPVSGSVTGVFNYAPKSITEIDYEVEGNERHHLFQLTSWKAENQPNEHTKVLPLNNELPHQRFFEIKFVWTPTEISYYRDDILVAKHTKVVPQTPCSFMFNHWGTNNKDWGGLATPGVERYVWIKYFSFTPL